MKANKKIRRAFLLASASALAVWLGYIFYSDYWVPSRDLRLLGVDFIKPWTPRRVNHISWIDGSQSTYTFELSESQEQQLRKRCRFEESSASDKTCYIARRQNAGEPQIDLSVQNGLLVMSYTG